MNICYLITSLGYGGAEKMLVNACSKLARDNAIDIIYFKSETSLIKQFDETISFHFIPLNVKCLRRTRELIKKLEPDIVHTNLGHADWIGLWSIRGLTLKRFCTMHNVWFKYNLIDQFIFLVYKILFKTVARDCKVICVSKSVKKHVINNLRVSQQRTFLMSNAIPDIPLINNKTLLLDQLNLEQDDFHLLFIGRLTKQKSVNTLIGAASLMRDKIKNLKVLIIGEGRKKAKLMDMVRSYKIEEIVDFRNATMDPENYFGAADVLVLPSLYEGMALVIIEAFRASLPVIASNVEGLSEIISNNNNGLLFEVGNKKELSEKISYLYNDDNARKNIGDAGRESFEKNFQIDRYAEELDTLYHKSEK